MVLILVFKTGLTSDPSASRRPHAQARQIVAQADSVRHEPLPEGNIGLVLLQQPGYACRHQNTELLSAAKGKGAPCVGITE